MKGFVEVSEVKSVLLTIEERVKEIRETSMDGHNAEVQCDELLDYVNSELFSIQLPTKNAVNYQP